jgi:hypothetical protein
MKKPLTLLATTSTLAAAAPNEPTAVISKVSMVDRAAT